MANRYYQDTNPANGTGHDDGVAPTQRDASSVKCGKPEPHDGMDEEIEIEAHSKIVDKEDMGLGNTATTRQKIGEASHD